MVINSFVVDYGRLVWEVMNHIDRLKPLAKLYLASWIFFTFRLRKSSDPLPPPWTSE